MPENAFEPLVEPGAELSPDQLRRYSRQLSLPGIGVDGQRRLAAARVLVVGAGGLGTPVIQYLAAAGVGTIGIVDDDTVDVSNLQRQVLHGVADVGRLKVDSGAETVARINPQVRVEKHAVRLGSHNALELLNRYHLVLDGADNFATRYLVGDACEILGLPCVWGSILRFDGQVSVFWPGRGPLYRDLFPQRPDPALVPSCAEAGVFGALCGSIGSAMSTEALKLITGVGRPLVGRLLVHDALAGSWREIPLAPAPNRRPAAELRAEDAASAVPGPSAAEPPSITARELASLLDQPENGLELIDVREATEAAIDRLPSARLLPMDEILTGRIELALERPIVLHCASGVRSARVAAYLIARGYTEVRHLEGGLEGYRRLFPA